MLTGKQLAVFKFIRSFNDRHGRCPTIREIVAGTTHHQSSAAGIVSQLVARGYAMRPRGGRLQLVRFDEPGGIETPALVGRVTLVTPRSERVVATDPPPSLQWGSNIRKPVEDVNSLVALFNASPIPADGSRGPVR